MMDSKGNWLSDAAHRQFLADDAAAQLRFFGESLRADGGFDVLNYDGSPIPDGPQELHTTTRLIHSYAMGHVWGAEDCTDIIDAGMAFLTNGHRDQRHGGYVWSVKDGAAADDKKLAYGHGFILLAAASAKAAGHPDADALLADIADVLEQRFWDEEKGLFFDEFNCDWSPFSSYRGYNANMHGTEALLSAYEATGEVSFLAKADRILSFFVDGIAPAHEYRLPEHFTKDWQVDMEYAGNPMFRPKGTTPGHSFELARLALQHWDLAGRPETGRFDKAIKLVERALSDAWLDKRGFAYTLDYDGTVQIADRYWWPVTEAIGVLACLQKLGLTTLECGDCEEWYRKLWQTASDLFIDPTHGGWYPELDDTDKPVARQFMGKPDIYHSIQADLMPLTAGVSQTMKGLKELSGQ